MRILYLGTPAFAVPTLQALIEWPEAEVVGLVTQPDRPRGRGKALEKPPTKVLAEAHGIPVFQPEKLSKARETVEQLKALNPDILVMVAFGQILKKSVLEMAPYGVVNLHASLLPRLRGAAPINWAIINGEKTTGNTTMFTDAGLDTGDMLLSQEVPIDDDTTAVELAETLSRSGADLVVATLKEIFAKTIERKKQDDEQSTYAPMLKKEMGIIDWTEPARTIHNKVRGLMPWPGTQTSFQEKPLKIIKTAPGQPDQPATPGLIVQADSKVIVSCGESGKDRLELLEVKPAGKNTMQASSWGRGYRLKAGDRLG